MPSPRPALALPLLLPLLGLAAGCAGGAPATTGAGPADSGWEGLLRARPEPLEGAPRVALSEILLVPADPWGVEGPVAAPLGVAELVAANLLRRRDVRFVERRRFAEAAERERLGLPRGVGAPPLGTSPGAEYLVAGAWSALAGDSATLDLRLVDAATGGTRASWRVRTPRDADPAGLARTVTASLLATLDSLGARPAGETLPDGAYRSTAIPTAAFAAFLQGLAAEDGYRWTAARDAYRRALSLGGGAFFEADEALARVARLRAGGTLGASP